MRIICLIAFVYLVYSCNENNSARNHSNTSPNAELSNEDNTDTFEMFLQDTGYVNNPYTLVYDHTHNHVSQKLKLKTIAQNEHQLYLEFFPIPNATKYILTYNGIYYESGKPSFKIGAPAMRHLIWAFALVNQNQVSENYIYSPDELTKDEYLSNFSPLIFLAMPDTMFVSPGDTLVLPLYFYPEKDFSGKYKTLLYVNQKEEIIKAPLKGIIFHHPGKYSLKFKIFDVNLQPVVAPFSETTSKTIIVEQQNT